MREARASDFADLSISIDACWRRIGIRGDKSCPELAQHSHCRNCPAYSLAAADLLDRQVSDDVLHSASGRLARPEPSHDGDTESVVIFRIGQEWFALPTLAMEGIVAMRAIHALPHRRNPALLGLANVRGELVVCVSLGHLLVGEALLAAKGRLVLVRATGGRIAFPVDEVQQTHHHRLGEMLSVPSTVTRSGSTFTSGLLPWRGRMIGRLDERLVHDALVRAMA